MNRCRRWATLKGNVSGGSSHSHKNPMQPTSQVRFPLGWFLFCFAATGAASAGESLHERVDRLLEASDELQARDAEPARDAAFLRRVYLDLTGVIPPADTVRDFLRERSAGKRREVVDRLLGSRAYARHMARVFDVLLMRRRRDRHVPAAEWRSYLTAAVTADKPWTDVVTEILDADGTEGRNRAAAKFYLDRQAKTDEIVRDISSIFLGRDLRCAQCHDHPTVDEYEQVHYQGLAAFLQRTYLVKLEGSDQAVLGEKAEGETEFASALTGEGGVTGPRVFDVRLPVDPVFPAGETYRVAPAEGIQAVPKFSRRRELALALADHPLFARNLANRLWAMVMGRGLVEPVDLHNAENPASHRQLLDLLAQELKASRYDIRNFLRELLLTRMYAKPRPALAPAASLEQAPIATPRPLSPEQLAWSLLQATGWIDAERRALEETKEQTDSEGRLHSSAESREKTLHARIEREAQPVVKTFVTSLPGEADGADATPEQALFLLNGAPLKGWLAPRAGNLIARLLGLDNAGHVAEELYLSVLSRLPREEERQRVARYLIAFEGEKTEALSDLVWALVTSVEFRFQR